MAEVKWDFFQSIRQMKNHHSWDSLLFAQPKPDFTTFHWNCSPHCTQLPLAICFYCGLRRARKVWSQLALFKNHQANERSPSSSPRHAHCYMAAGKWRDKPMSVQYVTNACAGYAPHRLLGQGGTTFHWHHCRLLATTYTTDSRFHLTRVPFTDRDVQKCTFKCIHILNAISWNSSTRRWM